MEIIISRIIMILKSLAVNWPVIVHWGESFDNLITILIKRGDNQQIIQLLSGVMSCKVVNYPFEKEKTIKNLCGHYPEIIVFPCATVKQVTEVKDFLLQIMVAGQIDGKPIKSLPIIVFDSDYIIDNDNRLFFIQMEKIPNIIYELDIKDVCPYTEGAIIAKDKKEKINIDPESECERILEYAATLLFPIHNSEKLLLEDIELIRDISRRNEAMHDLSDIPEIFLDCLIKWQRVNQLIRVIELPYIERDNEEKIRTGICYDDKFVYISEDIFNEIISNMEHIWGSNLLKKALNDTGILVTQNTAKTTYTVKMYYCNEYGNHISIRMLRFNRDKLKRDNDGIDFIDFYNYGE